MTRSELVKGMVSAEIDRQAAAIDATVDVRGVSVFVRFDRHNSARVHDVETQIRTAREP